MIIPFRTPGRAPGRDDVPDPEEARAAMARHPAVRAGSERSPGRATTAPSRPTTARPTTARPATSRPTASGAARQRPDGQRPVARPEPEPGTRHGRLREPGRHAPTPPSTRASASPRATAPGASSARVGGAERGVRPGHPGAVDVRPRGRRPEVVDPRIAARRDAVERQAQWKRARPVVLLLSFVVLALVAVGVVLSPVMSVQSVVVRGAAGGDANGVLTAAGVRIGTPLVRIDPAEVERRIESLSWIRSASVRRAWPRAVELRVAVRTLLAAVPVGRTGSLAVIDRDGWVLRTVASQQFLGEVPMLPAGVVDGTASGGASGATGTLAGTRLDLRPSGRSLLAVVESLDPDLRRRVRTVALEGPSVVLTIGGFTGDATLVARMGGATGLVDKAAALRSLVGRPELRSGGTVDLSVVDAPVILPAVAGGSSGSSGPAGGAARGRGSGPATGTEAASAA